MFPLFAFSCPTKHNQAAYVCYIEEESPVSTYLVDLTNNLCINLGQTNHSQAVNFILFPSSQPFYDYFIIRSAKNPSSNTPVHGSPVSQLLSLKYPIDREKLCIREQASMRSSTLMEDPIGLSPSGAFDASRTSCTCQKTMEWCSIYVQLALTPYQDAGRGADNLTILTDLALNIIDLFIIEVRIMDINDHAPTFLPKRYELSVSEMEQSGTKFRLPSASDLDIGKNAQFMYNLATLEATVSVLNNHSNVQRKNVSLEPEHSCLELQSNIDSTELFIRLKQMLDREQYDTYYLVITAVDTGSPHVKTGTLYVTMHVIDSNDQIPVFERPHYVFLVSESATPGTVVGQLVATDDDTGENGRVTYDQQIEPPVPITRHGPAINRFRVEPTTGQIRVHSPLDRELSKNVHFRVTARDHGQPVRTATANVMIILQDVNDNSPVIRIWGQAQLTDTFGLLSNASSFNYLPLSSPGLGHAVGLSVVESLERNAIVAFMDVYDPDSEDNGEVQCKVLHESFILQPISEYPKVFTMDQVVDGSIFSADSNNKYNKNHGVKLYQILSTRELDREANPSIHVPIVCRDNGSQIVRSSTTLLYIQVADVNDNAPIFRLPDVLEPALWFNKEKYQDWFYKFQQNPNESNLLDRSSMPVEVAIPETCQPNQTIMRFPARDIDDGINAMFEYDLVANQDLQVQELSLSKDPFDWLAIDSKTGHVSVQLPLWYIASDNWYHYVVRVKDQGQPALTATLPLSVRVQFVNKEAPKLEVQPAHGEAYGVSSMNSQSTIQLWLAEHEDPGTVIGRAIAFDSDHGEAGQVTYTLTQCLRRLVNSSWAMDPNSFAINHLNGLITNVRTIDREVDGSQYRITINAQDLGKPPKKSSVDVIVNIIDQNDHSPQFKLPFQPCLLSGTGTQLYRLMKIPTFRTAFLSATNQTIVQNLTRTYPNLYSPITTNLHPPSERDALQPIAEFSAVDLDEGKNGQVTYRIVPSCPEEISLLSDHQRMQTQIERTFSIDRSSGCLHLLRKLRFDEIGHQYTLRIVAQDSGSEVSLSTALDVWVSIQGQRNSFVELWLNITTLTMKCTANADHTSKNIELLVMNELSPTIRVLMSVTTVFGALLIIIIVVLFIKQPTWFFGRGQIRRRNETNKIDMFQCHEVHNHITNIGHGIAPDQGSLDPNESPLLEGSMTVLKSDAETARTEYPVAVFTCCPPNSKQSSVFIRLESPMTKHQLHHHSQTFPHLHALQHQYQHMHHALRSQQNSPQTVMDKLESPDEITPIQSHSSCLECRQQNARQEKEEDFELKII